jgi:trk system potassium uptake protein TrkA
MQVIVAGCGRVGSALARSLDADGHDVAIIDVDPHAFRRLGQGFGGSPVQGIVFDRGTLQRAGVQQCQAFIAVTSGDNSNVVAARTVKQHFRIPTVIARIYDPERASIYERYGITTIASARWTTDAILAHLIGASARVDATIGPGEGDVVVLSHDLPGAGGPWEVEAFSRQGRWLLAAVTRTGQTTVPVPRQLVQPGERIHLAVQRTALEEAEAFLDGIGTGAPTGGR